MLAEARAAAVKVAEVRVRVAVKVRALVLEDGHREVVRTNKVRVQLRHKRNKLLKLRQRQHLKLR